MKNNISKIITICTVCISILYFILMSGNNCLNLIKAIDINDHITNIVLVLSLFIAIHLIKMMRYYLILSESKLSLKTFVPLYLNTTLVNILIPFKLGEIYRFYTVGQACRNNYVSILSIITERFYDTSIIVLILLYQFIARKNPDIEVLSFLSLVIFIMFSLYVVFPSIYTFLNQYLILKSNSRQDIIYLKVLDKFIQCYHYEQKIVKGKGNLILLLSILSWAVEFFMFCFLTKIIDVKFSLYIFTKYINGIFISNSGIQSILIDAYSSIAIMCYTITIIIFCILVKKKWQNK